ncbi:hypothetical protein SRABI106_03715 [Rahnella aquatilis]|nr:hypothetical protein SRABI106_03715 [Rahnella aquatilis]
MPGVTNQNGFSAFTAGARNFHMNFGHQRTSRVKQHRQITRFRFCTYRLRNTVGRENQNRPIRYFADLLDKNSTALTQAVDHVAVMHHFMADIDRCAINFQRTFYNTDCAVNTRTKSSRISQQYLHVSPQAPGQFPALQYRNRYVALPADG